MDAFKHTDVEIRCLVVMTSSFMHDVQPNYAIRVC